MWRRRTAVSLAVGCAVLIEGVVGAGAANAAGGTFGYKFVGTCCISSREFDTRREADVWFDIDSMSPCDNWPGATYGVPTVRVALYHSDFANDTHIGNDKEITGCSGDVKWSMVNARDNLYFRITILYPHRDSRTYTVKGSVACDGART